jgi:methylated-DNA-[protein]-cysteine S-methyltransferase
VAVEIAHVTLRGPWGPYHLAATERGIVAGAWLTTEEAFLDGLGQRLHGLRIVTSGPPQTRLDEARPIVEAMLRGDPITADGIALDLTDRPEWDRRVLAAVRELAWGETTSYGGIARQVGVPRAARAVGGAVGRNPITLLIPCHRVIASDGTLGGYGGGGWGDVEERLALKTALLLQEGRTVPRRAG